MDDIGRYRIYDDGDESSALESGYSETVGHRSRILLLLVLVLSAVLLGTLIVNNWGYSPGEVLVSLLTHDTDSQLGRFVWNLDVPVLFAALLVGAGLSLAGLAMQCVLRNPLASPYTLGLSNAAAFGAALSIMAFGGGAALTGFMQGLVTPALAFLFAMIATGLVLALAKLTRVSSETMVLAGIAVSAIFSAGLTLMQYLADPVQLSNIVSWTFGNINYARMGWDLAICVVVILIGTYFYLNRWTMNAMNAGDEVARGLGVNTDRFMMVGLSLSALVAGVIVAQFGVIAFVGLLGPHMARMVLGDDHRFLVPGSMVAGALLMALANVVASNIVLPMVLPVGLLTSLLGGPIFIYLLVRRYRA